MARIVISGTGVFLPENQISNDELVESFNRYANKYNKRHEKDIEAKRLEPMRSSDANFILKASGINKRWVLNKEGILDEDVMHPVFKRRTNDQMSLQCEIAVKSVLEALQNAEKTPREIDAIILACSNYQRPYPALAIEVQAALGIDGFAFDMNVACASAAFAIASASSMIEAGTIKCALVVNPEIYTGHLNFRDRSSHFIFGDASTAAVIEKSTTARSVSQFEILSCRLKTKFSNNIRNNFGFLNRAHESDTDEILFKQNGKNVREEVTVIAAQHMKDHVRANNINVEEVQRLWLHQANIHMNNDIASYFFERPVAPTENPTILHDFANTGAAGVMIAFNKNSRDLPRDAKGVLCSFGAGYAVGSLILQKI